MPFLPSSMVTASGGANRWIRLPGFSLSPVEFFKIGFIYFLSWSFHRKVIDKPKKIGLKDEALLLAPYFFAFFVVVFIVAFLQKDLGQVVLLGVILVVLLIFANRSFKLFLVLGALALMGLVGLILAAPHRMQRIYSWWAMVQDGILSILPSWAEPYLRIEELPEPYQVSHSLNAIHNGGFFGQGISLGDIKVGFLSEVHTDFVLAGITEEIGLIGLICIIAILFMIVWRIFRISRRVENPIYHLFTLGIALMIIVAFLINSYGISGMIPIKGIAVPLLSYGGSSMLSMAIAIGLVLSISRKVNFEYEEKVKKINEKR
jgi:cell division protein FtsW